MLEATLLENVSKDQTICTQEAFGPVAVLSPFDDFETALDEVNDTTFGLQAGIFLVIFTKRIELGTNWTLAES